MPASNFKKSPPGKRRAIFITLGVAALLVVGGAGYWKLRSNNNASVITPDPEISTTDPVLPDSNGSTKPEPATTIPDGVSKDPSQTTPAPVPTENGLKKATVVFTDAGTNYGGTYEFHAYADGVREANATCTLTLTKSGSTPITKSVTAVENASNMTCPTIRVPASDLSAGSWSVKVEYKSNASQGSATSTLTVT
jgi:hypothetical protein